MKLIKLNCAACGAPISIPENLEQLTCYQLRNLSHGGTR